MRGVQSRAEFEPIVTAVTAAALPVPDTPGTNREAVMHAKTLETRTVERVVVDQSFLRSRPRTMRVSLPYLRLLDEPPLPTDAAAAPVAPSRT
jgi:hypothetical protein